MQHYFAFIGVVFLFAMLIWRAAKMKKKGIKAIVFGSTDKSDYLLGPIFLVFLYEVIAHAFQLPLPFGERANQFLYTNNAIRWLGVGICFSGLSGFFLSLRSFGDSFRVGIDEKKADRLVTTGIFAISRNPIYVSFGFFFFGIFLMIPNLVFMTTFLIALLLFHRQVLREEAFLKGHYGDEYTQYCKKVRRYL